MSIVKKIFNDFVVPVLVALVLWFIINKFVLFKIYIPSPSMVPTLKEGDQLFVTRVYNTDNLDRGDIVVFYLPERGDLLIKRLIGLPGDKIDINDKGEVFVNGEKRDEPYVVNKSTVSGSYQVPEGKFFFLGDNRADSLDSRYWKEPYVSKEDIKGEARIIVFPFSRFGLVD